MIPVNDGSRSFIQLSSKEYAQDLPIYSENTETAKQHTDTLYEDVNTYSAGVAGAYVKLRNFKNGTKSKVIPFRYIVPVSDLKPLQGFSMYPSEIIGQLALMVTFTMLGLVYYQVKPHEVYEVEEFLSGTPYVATTVAVLTIPFDRKLTQIYDTASILDINVAGNAYEARTVTPILDGFSITR